MVMHANGSNMITVRLGAMPTGFPRLAALRVVVPPSPLTRSFGIMMLGGNSSRSLGLKDLRIKSLITNDLRDPLPFDCAQSQDFGSGTRPFVQAQGHAR